jgi:hypothetical protein
MRISAQFNDPRVAIVLYNAYIRNKLEYGAIIWDPYEEKYVMVVERVQRKFAHWLYKKDMGTHHFGGFKLTFDWFKFSLPEEFTDEIDA